MTWLKASGVSVSAACRRLVTSHPLLLSFLHMVKLFVLIFLKDGRHQREQCLNLVFWTNSCNSVTQGLSIKIINNDFLWS